MASDWLLEMVGISKSFPGVRALDDVCLRVRAGSVHALIGENGAGKSTLMKVLNGMYRPDAGEIRLRGEPVQINGLKGALDLGISMIYQELNPIPAMTVAENIFIGREPVYGRSGVVNRRKMNADARRLFETLGLDMNPSARLSSLSVAEMQMVEIAKAISFDSEIIVMDEPTSAITDREVEKLFEIIRTLKAANKAVIYISHKMNELFQIADEMTVMRDGRYIDTQPTDRLTPQSLISMMVGRRIDEMFPKEDVPLGEVVLSVDGLTQAGRVRNVSFELRRGEILGIAGLMGAGRTELVETIFGIRKASAGQVRIDGRPVAIASPRDAIRHRIALVSEDRKLMGLNLRASVKDNVSLIDLGRYCNLGGVIRARQEVDVVRRQIDRFKIKVSSYRQIVDTLSGGNQQKVVIAKWILTDPEIIILDEPTRGIDVGAKSEIHKIMVALAREGKAIIMISSELPEVLGMSDRILVMHDGEVTGEYARADFNQEAVMASATGNH
ncbi:sugar ABC transporter ATP-binding protein [Pleomorphomonas koreensis]|uniref:sugar ABC transporter ATP-binding protein n=1 Tax=Pleomorphomonas koreensis TaxID=257440 RepID=UPI00047B7A80